MTISVALRWSADLYTDSMVGFANNIRTTDGGSHLDGEYRPLNHSLCYMYSSFIDLCRLEIRCDSNHKQYCSQKWQVERGVSEHSRRVHSRGADCSGQRQSAGP